jgi:hypothetical protein
MKTILCLFLGLCLSASAQVGTYFAVSFYATNSPQVLAGWPQWEPLPQGVRALGTATGPTYSNEVLFAWTDVNALIATNAAAFSAYQQNQSAPKQAQINALTGLYNQIPAGLMILSNDMNSLTNVYASLASGTNTTAQAVTQINKGILAQNDQANVLQVLLQFIQQLGPVLQQIYASTQP